MSDEPQLLAPTVAAELQAARQSASRVAAPSVGVQTRSKSNPDRLGYLRELVGRMFDPETAYAIERFVREIVRDELADPEPQLTIEGS